MIKYDVTRSPGWLFWPQCADNRGGWGQQVTRASWSWRLVSVIRDFRPLLVLDSPGPDQPHCCTAYSGPIGLLGHRPDGGVDVQQHLQGPAVLLHMVGYAHSHLLRVVVVHFQSMSTWFHSSRMKSGHLRTTICGCLLAVGVLMVVQWTWFRLWRGVGRQSSRQVWNSTSRFTSCTPAPISPGLCSRWHFESRRHSQAADLLAMSVYKLSVKTARLLSFWVKTM